MNKRMTGYINWKRNRKSSLGADTLNMIVTHMQSHTPNHIAVTGDLTNLALPKEFQNASSFLKSLGEPENVSAICGNHDAYVRGGLSKSIKAWRPWLSSDEQDTVHANDFPYTRIRNDIAIIGCNSAEATLPFMATGYFRKSQAERLAKALNDTRGMCRVVLIHHPPFHNATPSYKRLIGIDLFQDVIKTEGAELILHGHTHLDTKTSIDGPNTKVPVICVPAAGQGIGGHKPAAQYNLFHIQKSKSNWEIEMQSFGLDQTGNGIEEYFSLQKI